MENIWFTSDTHFFHNRILEFCRETRRGNDAEEMTWLMIDAWNKLIKPGDRVYHAGDFSFGGKDKVLKSKLALNGQIHLIAGNHDKLLMKNSEIKELFTSVQDMKHLKIGDNRFIICHFPFAEWWDCHKGTIHLHGHVHGGTKNTKYQQKFKIMDIGVDSRNDNLMLPFHIDEVLFHMKHREIMTHHDGD